LKINYWKVIGHWKEQTERGGSDNCWLDEIKEEMTEARIEKRER
jgi:hypothetical protein